MNAPGFIRRNDKLDVDVNVVEVLKQFGTKTRYLGVVSKIDLAGTTTFIKSGDSEFLTWSKPELTVGANVTFRIDQFRAVDVKAEQ